MSQYVKTHILLFNSQCCTISWWDMNGVIRPIIMIIRIIPYFNQLPIKMSHKNKQKALQKLPKEHCLVYIALAVKCFSYLPMPLAKSPPHVSPAAYSHNIIIRNPTAVCSDCLLDQGQSFRSSVLVLLKHFFFQTSLVCPTLFSI